MISHLTTVLVLLLLYVESTLAAPRSSRKSSDTRVERRGCVIEEDFQSPYVKALYNRYSDITGCVSNETTAQQQEVHVIKLVGVDEGDRLASVTLKLRPRSPTGLHDGPLVFVLQSPRPVQWRLQVDRISNSSRHHFLISSDSRLMKRDLPLRSKIKKYDLPSERELLERWVRQNQGAMSSFAEIQRADSVEKMVGPDPAGTDTCVVRQHLQTSSILARYLEPQLTKGCAAPWRLGLGQGKSDVHIVDLGAPSSDPTVENRAIVEVTLDIETGTPGQPRGPSKTLLLVLKSRQPVQWTVVTHRLRGAIDIITNGRVDTESVPKQVKISVMMERLDASGSALVSWVAERYGAPVSYTDVPLANRFELTAEGGDVVVYTPTKPGPRGQPVSQDSRSPFLRPGITHEILMRAHKVACHSQGINVYLSKGSMRRLDIHKENLALLDPKCQAKDNGTHFILSSTAAGGQGLGCGTTIDQQGGSTIYKQSIVLSSSLGKKPQDEDDEEGSGSGQGAPGDETFTDDEDYHRGRPPRERVITIDVNCRYHGQAYQPVPSPRVMTETINNVEYSFKVFTDGQFQQPITRYPQRVSDQGTLYVEAGIQNADRRVRVVIQKCWLAPPSFSETERQHILVRNGCKVDASVSWIPTPNHREDMKRFSFRYYKYYGQEDVTSKNLHCELRVCSLDSQFALDIPRCMEPDKYCVTENIQSDQSGGATVNTHSEVVTAGPLMLIMKSNGFQMPGQEANVDTSGQSTISSQDQVPGTGTGCEKVIVEGLDSGTVVGIAFAAFVIGVLLTGALWYIHTHTGPMAMRGNRPRSAETSGESTPSSTAPITIHQIHHH